MKQQYKNLIFSLIKIFILICYSLFFMKLVISKEILKLLHPRNVIFVKLCFVALLFMAISFMTKIKTIKHTKFDWELIIVFILPLIVFSLYNSKVISIDSLPFTNTTYDIIKTNISKNNTSIMEVDDAIMQPSYQGPLYGENELEPSLDVELTNGKIVLNSDNYFKWVIELYDKVDSYVGTEIEITGFIFNDPELDSSSYFMSARKIMVCCAADMGIIGFVCKYDEDTFIEEENTWVSIKGSIIKEQIGSLISPVIQVDTIEKIEEPLIDYIYAV